MHPTKRRRLDAANATLCKPFRSPLRITTNANQSQTPAADKQLSKKQSAVTLATATPPHHRFPPSSTHETCPPSSSSTATEPLHTDLANVDDLQKEYSSLARKLTVLRQSLDIAQQALKIETSDQSSDLDRLITRWRSVVRETADELFEDAKLQIDKEGGLRSWLKRNKREPPDPWYDEGEVKLTDAQRTMLEMQREDERAEAEKYGLVEKSPSENEDDDEEGTSFTMDIMLQQMNIDLDLVGYNQKEQRWAD